MTSTASSNAVSAEKQHTVNAFRHNFFEQLKDSKKMMIIVFIMHFFAAPVIFLSAIYNCAARTGIYPDDMFGVIGIFTTIIAAGCGIIIALNIFKYLYKRPVVDMSLSLPLSGNEKFFSDFLAGLTAYFAPFIAAELFSFIFLGIGQLVFGGKIITYTRYDYTYSEVCKTFSDTAFPLFELVIGGIIIMLMLYVMTVLVMTCCGTLFESAAYTLMLNGLIPAVIVCGIALFFNDLYGIDFDEQFYEILGFTSPAGGAYGLANAITESVDNRTISSVLGGTYDPAANGATIVPLLKWMLPMILITAAMFGISYLLYRKRKAEQVTKPFVFRVFYNIIVTAAIFCILSVFLIENEIGVPAFITTGIVFLIFEVVTNRGFKKIWKSAVKYVVIVAAVFGVNFISRTTDGFGIVNKVPSAGSVSSVMVSTSYGTEIGYTFSETENIQKIIDIHKYCLESRNADYENSVYSFNITYKLRSGGNMTRRYYSIPIAEMNKYAEITATKEGHKCRAEYVYNHLTDRWENYLKNADSYRDDYISTFTIYAGVGGIYSRSLNSASLPKDFGYRLAEALRDDILDETPEQYLRSEAKLYSISDDYGFSIMILPHFTRTINYLTGCGVKPFDTPDLNGLSSMISSADLYIGAPDNEFTKQNGGVTSTYCYSGDIIYYNDSNGFLTADRKTKCDDEFLEKLDKLIKVSSERYITTESCYTIVVGGTVYVVPPEYTKLADEVYKYCVSPSSLEDTEEYYD